MSLNVPGFPNLLRPRCDPVKLSDIKTIQPGQTLKDDVVPGLQLRCRTSVTSWHVYYRNARGQERRPKIGEYPTIGLEQARQVAKKMLGAVAHGEDPSRDKSLGRRFETMGQLADRLVIEHGPTKKSKAEDERRIRLYVKPRWGDMPAMDFTKDDLSKFKVAMKDKPVSFNRVRSMLSKMLNHADLPNPVKKVEPYPEKKRHRYLTPDEFKAISDAFVEVEKTFPHQVALLRILILTGARTGEIAKAKRKWLVGNMLSIPDTKGGEPKQIYLSDEALEILRQLPAYGEYLCGIHSRPQLAWDKIIELSKLEDFRIHDLRHTFASFALEGGYSLAQIGKLLGHKSPATTNRYAHLMDGLRRSMANDLALGIAGRLAGVDKITTPGEGTPA